jgi:glutathione S-transferase
MEQWDVWQSTIGIGRGIHIPGSVSGVIFVAVATAVAVYFAYLKTRRHPLASNSATIAGIATACTLIWWPTHWCDLRGGIAAGLMAAGIVAALAMVVGFQARKARQNTDAQRDNSIG